MLAKSWVLTITSVILSLGIATNFWAQRPEWFDKVTVLSGGSEMSAFASGGTWGAKIVEGDAIEFQANQWHAQGGIYHGFYRTYFLQDRALNRLKVPLT